MAQQILIIGLGQFGMALAHALAEKGAEVLAVDRNRNRVEEAAAFAAEAVAIDATDEEELLRLQPAQRDAVVCAIGDSSKEASIICTALLRQMGVRNIVSRANDKVHKRILQLVGANEIITPELEFGKRFATKLLYRHILADTTLGDDLLLTEICPPPAMVGKNLIQLELPRKFDAIVAAIRRNGKLQRPNPNEPLSADDRLIIVSSEEAIAKLSKEA
ncbi:MAG: TrkA family potassium uptake protein [Lentisphaeria bacterium]|nr:TrkA family potassium uptake protein [Lentisphaeria bacterium]MBQ8755277.1 TrkA family potassium uptake protein [Lentisphaeria bacterium]MBQ9776461.1 TrkA family potassium uptake protein [Lentisphaeria bacterium]